jgi:hypothetical protein
VPKGKYGEGWKRFGEELRLALNSLFAGSFPKHAQGKEVSQSKSHSKRRRSYAEVLRASRPKDTASFYFTEEDSRIRVTSPAKGCRDQAVLTANLDTANHAGLKIDMLEKDFPAEPAGLKTVEMKKIFPAYPDGMKFQNSLSATSSSEIASDLKGRGRALVPLCWPLHHASFTSMIASSCAVSGRRWRRYTWKSGIV